MDFLPDWFVYQSSYSNILYTYIYKTYGSPTRTHLIGCILRSTQVKKRCNAELRNGRCGRLSN